MHSIRGYVCFLFFIFYRYVSLLTITVIKVRVWRSTFIECSYNGGYWLIQWATEELFSYSVTVRKLQVLTTFLGKGRLTSTFSTTCFPKEHTFVEHVIVILSLLSYLWREMDTNKKNGWKEIVYVVNQLQWGRRKVALCIVHQNILQGKLNF